MTTCIRHDSPESKLLREHGTVIKTYFLVDSETCKSVTGGKQYDGTDTGAVYEFQFPIEFYSAKNDKWLEVRYCYALFDGYLMSDIVLHSDFITRDAYLDSSVSVINVLNNGAKPDKYLIPEGSPKFFHVWFTNLRGERMTPNAFQLKMMLIYST